MLEALVRHRRHDQLDDFLTQGDGCRWCRHPIRLRGFVISGRDDTRSVTFTSASQPDGVILKGCGSRSEVRCPACAEIYRGDARHLVRAGLEGGKGVPESVAQLPAIFVTLTAPSFGTAHTLRGGEACQTATAGASCLHGRPLACRQPHQPADEIVGSPICLDCYDYVGAVLQNSSTPELWRRTMIYLQRRIASVLGSTQAESTKLVRLSFCRVAEFQSRGLVHLHAIVRAGSAGDQPPTIEADQLAVACLEAAESVSVHHPRGVAHWGSQLDVQVLGTGDQRLQRVASYLAKYATKTSSENPRLDARITSLGDLEERALPPHLHQMVATALSLSEDPALARLNLARHAHRLGFGGHFLTKSQNYSTTFGALRDARARWQEARCFGGTVPADRVVERRWRAVGAGWANQGEALFAGYQQRQRAEERREALFAWHTRRD